MSTSFWGLNRWIEGLVVSLMFGLLLPAVQPVRMQEAETHSLIAFASSDYQIYSMTSDGTVVSAIADFSGQYPDWSPDGTQLAFTSDRFDGVYQVVVGNVEGGNPRQLTTDRHDDKSRPSWSPDGDWIAFDFGRVEQRDVYLVRPDGTDLTNLTNTPNKDEYFLDWSPDGQHLLIRVLEGTDSGVYLTNRDGAVLSRQPQFLPQTSFAQWSPDGQLFAFTSDYGAEDGHDDIYLMNTDGSDLINLTDNEADDFGATWSPDGVYLAFASDRTGGYDVFRMRIDGSEVINLTENLENQAWFPSWSPFLPGPAPTAAPPTLAPIPVTLTPSAVECPDAPPSRLNIGMSAAVIMPTEQEPERQNLRVRDATEGEPLGLLEPGTGFRIVGGPECGAAGQRWWEIETLDGSVRGWSVEGFAPDDYLMVPF